MHVQRVPNNAQHMLAKNSGHRKALEVPGTMRSDPTSHRDHESSHLGMFDQGASDCIAVEEKGMLK